MPGLALIGCVLFVLVTVGWRSWLQYRRTGDSGFRGFSGGVVDRLASLLFLAGLLLAPLAPILELAHVVTPLAFLSRPLIHGAGISVVACGFTLTVTSQYKMGASWRIGLDPDERTALVTDGVFSQVRNPIFSGILLSIVGLVLLVPNLVAILAALVTFAGVELQVRLVEEPCLLRTHGDAYREYARSVGRFLPGIGRLR